MFAPATLLRLSEYWVPSVERVGLILDGGRIQEVQNISQTPSLDFIVPRSVVDVEGAVAMWHTHPLDTVALSSQDLAVFLSLPHLRHLIVAQRRIREFTVVNGKVLTYATHRL